MKPDGGWGIANPGWLAGWLATHIWVGASTIFRGKQLAASYGLSRRCRSRSHGGAAGLERRQEESLEGAAGFL
eukprot:3789642-Prymnesium_polylepis.1